MYGSREIGGPREADEADIVALRLAGGMEGDVGKNSLAGIGGPRGRGGQGRLQPLEAEALAGGAARRRATATCRWPA